MRRAPLSASLWARPALPTWREVTSPSCSTWGSHIRWSQSYSALPKTADSRTCASSRSERIARSRAPYRTREYLVVGYNELMIVDLSDIVRVLVPAFASFVIGMALTPILTHYLYKYKAWKKSPGKLALDGSPAHGFNDLHRTHETRAPRMGGIVVWGSVFITILGIALI